MKHLLLRAGNSIPLDDKQAEKIVSQIGKGSLIHIVGQYIQAFEVVGIVDNWFLDETERSRRGQWKCKFGYWHRRWDKCECKISRYDQGDSTFTTNGEKAIPSPEEVKLLGEENE